MGRMAGIHPTEQAFFVSYRTTTDSTTNYFDYVRFNTSTQEFDLVQKITVPKLTTNAVGYLGVTYATDSTGDKLFVGDITAGITGAVLVFHKENGLYVLKHTINGATDVGLPINSLFGNALACNGDGTELLIQSHYSLINNVLTAAPQLYYYVYSSTLGKYVLTRTVTAMELAPIGVNTGRLIKYSITNKCWYIQNTSPDSKKILRIDFVNNEPVFTTIVSEPLKNESNGNNSNFGYSFDTNANDTVMAVGSPDRSHISDREGSVHVFKKINGVWNSVAYLPGESGYISEQLGVSLVISEDGSTVATGSQMGSYTNAYESSFYTIIE